MASPSPNGAPKMEPSSDIIIQQNAKRIRDFLPNIPGLPLTVLLLNSKTQTVQYSVQQTQWWDWKTSLVYLSLSWNDGDFIAIDTDGNWTVDDFGSFRGEDVKPNMKTIPQTGKEQLDAQNAVKGLLEREDIVAAKKAVLEVLGK